MALTLDFEPTLTLDTQYTFPKKFFVVGAGGTGGYFIPHLTRQVALQNNLRRLENLEPHEIYIIEGDTVSLNNLNRQNFIESDLDHNKGQVMQERYGTAFKTNAMHFKEDYLLSADQLINMVNEVCKNHSVIPVLVDCVDNNKTRVFIHKATEKLSERFTVYSLSSGNELYNGQVICGCFPRGGESYYEDNDIFRTPCLGDMFPEVLEGNDKLPTELSCDEQAISHPQSIMTNVTAATLLFNFANILMLADPGNPTLPGLTYFAQTFDTQNGTNRRFPNKKSVINQYL